MVKLTENDVDRIVELLNQDKIVAMPTDTIYGFSCLATSNKAVKTLCNLKKCSNEKLFIILVSKSYDLSKLVSLNDSIKEFVKNNTPNPVTMIVEKNPSLKLAKNFEIPTIAIRIPDNGFLQKILDKVGFMISTSCNIHGQQNLTNPTDIINTFGSLDAIVESNTANYNSSSTIVDLTTNPHKVIRQGGYIVK